MTNDILNQTISEVSLNAILSIVALILSILGIILSVLFFVWGRREQKEASEIYNRVFNENNNLINIINEKINLLGQSEDKTRDTLIKYVMDSNAQLMTEKIKEKVEIAISQSDFSNNNQEATEKFKSIITDTFVESVSRENIKQIQQTNAVLSQLSRIELSTLYTIWNLQNKHQEISIEKIIAESNLLQSEVELALQSLRDKSLLSDGFRINTVYSKVFNNLFDIDEYTGMRFAEKINALKELIQRIPKVT